MISIMSVDIIRQMKCVETIVMYNGIITKKPAIALWHVYYTPLKNTGNSFSASRKPGAIHIVEGKFIFIPQKGGKL